VDNRQREEEWATWLRAAISGDSRAYRRFLDAVTPYLRAMTRRRCEQAGMAASDIEDIVQEALLAIHLKRGTWDPLRPVGPWISTIIRNKLIDAIRRRHGLVSVPIDNVIDTLAAPEPEDAMVRRDVEHMLGRLKASQRDIVRAISIDGAGIRETAQRLAMSEGAVRVALHRGLKTLAALFRSETS
jgi:RNA polymerase sigma-70 factor (ECF subfamily)